LKVLSILVFDDFLTKPTAVLYFMVRRDAFQPFSTCLSTASVENETSALASGAAAASGRRCGGSEQRF